MTNRLSVTIGENCLSRKQGELQRRQSTTQNQQSQGHAGRYTGDWISLPQVLIACGRRCMFVRDCVNAGATRKEVVPALPSSMSLKPEPIKFFEMDRLRARGA